MAYQNTLPVCDFGGVDGGLAFSEATFHSSLDPHETKCPQAVDALPWGSIATSLDSTVVSRHCGWARRRELVRRAMTSAGLRPRVVSRFLLCGSDPWVVESVERPGTYRIASHLCRSRFCVPCARARGYVIRENLLKHLRTGVYRFVTLTLKHNDRPLREQLDRLYASFRKLRKSKVWRDNVDGGAAICEIVVSKTDGLWHVHLHVVVHGSYLPQHELSAAWLRASGDSRVVDIRLVRSSAAAAQYVAKYCGKPFSGSIFGSFDRLVEYVGALVGRRLVLTFGDWRGYRLSDPLSDDSYRPLCPLPILIERADHGDPQSINILNYLRSNELCSVTDVIAVRSPPIVA